MGITQIKEEFNRFKGGHASVERYQRSERSQIARNAAVAQKVENVMKDRRLTVQLGGVESHSKRSLPDVLSAIRDNTLGGHGSSTSLSLPPTSREDLQLNGYLQYPMSQRHFTLQISMSSPGFEPRPYDTEVSVANHCTRWVTYF
ncbi:hypothetical protein TNCV_2830831 [Trichonephila clavipes]|nr:hypothetical protein TNCV_2830831 [Trichonephila clavipes]